MTDAVVSQLRDCPWCGLPVEYQRVYRKVGLTIFGDRWDYSERVHTFCNCHTKENP